MFRDYQELFNEYIEFYKDTLFSDHHQPTSYQNIYNNQESNNFQQSRSTINLFRDEIGWTKSSFLPAAAAAAAATQSHDDLALSSSIVTLTTNNFDLTAQEANFHLSMRHNLSTSNSCCTQRADRETTLIIDTNNEPNIRVGYFNGLNGTDLLYIVTIFLNLLFIKRCLSRYIRSSDSIKGFGLRKKDYERLDESVWRLLYYTFSSTWLVYSCFFKHNAQKFFDKNAKINEYLFGVDLDEYLICMIEIGFYLHATYAIVFEDVWRRDSPMMLLHHVAAIISVVGVYATRTHRIGLASIVLRDTCDVLLEMTKIFLCFRIQHGKTLKSMEISVKLMLILFTYFFVVNQLYYYPLFCLYHGFNMIRLHKIATSAITGIMTCGSLFLVLDLLWFGLILRLLYRMLLTNEPLKDLREYEDEDSSSEQEASNEEAAVVDKRKQELLALKKNN